jgi:hypothetical protein
MSRPSQLAKVRANTRKSRDRRDPSLEDAALRKEAKRAVGKAEPRLSALVGRRTRSVLSETSAGFFMMVNGVILGDEVLPRRDAVSPNQQVAAVAAHHRGVPEAPRIRANFPAATFSPVIARRVTSVICCTTLARRQPPPAEARRRVTRVRARRRRTGTEAKIKRRVLVVCRFLSLLSL